VTRTLRAVVELVSWNVNRHDVWNDLGADTELDFALLQECPRPPAGQLEACVPPADGDWTTTHWPSELRTCIAQLSNRYRLVPHGLRDLHNDNLTGLGVSRRGTLSVADIYRGEDRLVTVAAAYAAWERSPDRTGFIYADASAHRLLSDLTPLLTGRRDERLVVAGDSTSFSGTASTATPTLPRAISPCSTALGRWDCASSVRRRREGGRRIRGRQELPRDSLKVPTFYHSRQTPATATRQLDFVFATENIADQVTVRAINAVEEWAPSDHCRIAISVDLRAQMDR
jgi:hypothetical protein